MNLTPEQRCELAANYLCTLFKVNAPKRTFNLSINGIAVVHEGNQYAVVIGGEVAPYAVYTNEVWINRKGTNPNQGWIESTIYEALPMLKVIFQGKYTKDNIKLIRQENLKNRLDFRAQQLAFAAMYEK